MTVPVEELAFATGRYTENIKITLMIVEIFFIVSDLFMNYLVGWVPNISGIGAAFEL